MRALIAVLALAALAAAQDASEAVVGVQARRQVNFRGRTMTANVRQAGVIIDDDLVLTPSLGETAENIRVFREGAPAIDAEIVESGPHFTLLRAAELAGTPVEFRKTWAPRVGDRVAWIGILGGAVGRWTPLSKPAAIDALLEDEQGGVDAYSDPPFSPVVTAAGALVVDDAGRAVGIVAMRRQDADGGGRARFRRAGGLPVVRPASQFLHYLDGSVASRGVLGVVGEPLGEKVAAAFGMEGKMGVLVTQVTPGSGAAGAGIRPQDVVAKVDGEAVGTVAALQQALRAKRPGDAVSLEVVRLGDEGPETLAVEAKLGARVGTGRGDRLRARRFGFVAEPITPAVRRDQGLAGDVKGLHVRRVTAGSPAALGRPTGLERGDVVLRVGEKVVPDLEALKAALASIPDGIAVTFFVRNGAQTRFVEIRPEAADR